MAGDPAAMLPGAGICACPLGRHAARAHGSSGILSDAERVRRDAFRWEEDRARFVLGRAIVRMLCGRFAGTDPAAVEIGTGPNGKPHVAGSPHFNVAHSGDWVLVAWSVHGPVGIDVEHVRADPAMPSPELAARVLGPEELRVLAAVPLGERHRTFLQIWACKEAVVKADGAGIAVGLDRFPVVGLEPDGAIRWATCVTLPGSTRLWSVSRLDLDADHPAAFATDDAGVPPIGSPEAFGFW